MKKTDTYQKYFQLYNKHYPVHLTSLNNSRNFRMEIDAFLRNNCNFLGQKRTKRGKELSFEFKVNHDVKFTLIVKRYLFQIELVNKEIISTPQLVFSKLCEINKTIRCEKKQIIQIGNRKYDRSDLVVRHLDEQREPEDEEQEWNTGEDEDV